jgi:hypothetical protein
VPEVPAFGSSVMIDSEPEQVPKTQSAPSGGPPEPPKKTARGQEDGSPRPDPTAVIKRVALLVLSQAQRDRATDLVMGPAADGGTSIRYKIDGVWCDWVPGGFAWPLVLSELGGLAGIRDEPYPKEGIIYVAYSGVRVRWHIRMTSEKTECFLRDLGRAMV